MNKSKAVFASMALVAVALAPLALAHNNSNPWVLDSAFSGVKKTNGDDRVSGVYYKDVSALVGFVGNPIGSQVCADPVDPDTCVGPIDPTFTVGVANALCDMEVLSDGTATGDPADERQIDAADSDGVSTLPAGGQPAALGTLFDDGGIGAACHTHADYYEVDQYNTPGCTYDPAFATDISTRPVWLTTVCDYAHSTAGVGLVNYLLACVNNLFTTDPVTAVSNIVGCATDVVDCFADTTFSCPLSTGQACGGDADGNGGVQTPGNSGWSNAGVAFESVPSPCSDGHGAAAVFVWTAAFVDSVSPPGLGTVQVSAPTVGAIY